MAEDIGIELHDKIKQVFDVRCEKDSTLTHIKRKIENGTATMEDTSVYARRLGELLRKSIESTTKPDDLPGEKMYYNIAQSILEPLLRDNYEDVNGICAEVQRALDAKKGIGLKPQKADFPAERIRAAIGGAAVKETAEHAIQVLGRTAENITGSFQTDYIKKNAEFRSKAGLNCYIERKDGHNCCDWCTKLAGRYRYPDEVPKDVYRRHDNCTCDVSYVSEKGRQNVHSKRWANEQAKAQRIEYAASLPKPMKLTKAEAIAKESEILAQRRLTYDRKRGIIQERDIASRNLPNGLRTAPNHILTDDEILSLKKDIEAIGADLKIFKFNSGRRTGYDDVLDEIRVKGDILPDLNSNHPRDRMSSRAALAHEYYGHRANRGTKLPNGAWNDEFRASYMAAKNCPNLSDEERRDLILDALERAKEKGITIRNNDFIRRTLYGY